MQSIYSALHYGMGKLISWQVKNLDKCDTDIDIKVSWLDSRATAILGYMAWSSISMDRKYSGYFVTVAVQFHFTGVTISHREWNTTDRYWQKINYESYSTWRISQLAEPF